MPVNLRQARALCTNTEMRLIRASLPAEVKRLPPSRLKAKIARTRKLRNKYRDLAYRQRGEARGKRFLRGARVPMGKANMLKKAELFGEALARFEDALTRGEVRPVGKGGRTTKPKAKRTTKSAKKTPPPKVAIKTRETANEVLFRRKSARFERSGRKRIFAHISSRGRRKQARRDRRR